MFFSKVRPLISAENLSKRIIQLGEEITSRYQNDDNLIIIGTLKGSLLFMADLIRNIRLPIELDFISISSYHGGTSSGSLQVLHGISSDITGCSVLLIEDIVDTGKTLVKLKEMISKKDPKSIEVCALLDKPSRRDINITVDYTGFTIDDLFVVGYGLDYMQKYRNLPFIGTLDGVN